MVSRLLARATLSATRQATRRATLRRYMSSEPGHSSSSGSDTVWMIGSAAVFGPMFAYLLLPSKKQDHGHSHAEPHKDARRGSGSSTHLPPEPEVMADSEGKEEDVSASVSQAIEADSPKEAAGSEAEDTSSSVSIPAQTDTTVTSEPSEPDLKTEGKSSIFKVEGEQGPIDVSTARTAARLTTDESGTEAPKKAKEDTPELNEQKDSGSPKIESE